jgi:transcriptional regulator with XRE-family HTH domain
VTRNLIAMATHRRDRARRIKRARKKKSLSRAELAARVGVSRQAVYDWENGAEAKLHNLVKVAAVTDTPLAELVGA